MLNGSAHGETSFENGVVSIPKRCLLHFRTFLGRDTYHR
ncbi:hypothetical protein D2M30_0470 [Bacillus amyloliquefaciens]|nr:hypothetical protein D2M30_0470 [Bacillus amyloliquefaciens]